jgi:hypothetical protein
VFHRDKTKDAHPESCCSTEKGGQPLPWFEHRKNVPQFAEPTETLLGPDSGKGAKSLVELLVSNLCLTVDEGMIFEGFRWGVERLLRKLIPLYLGDFISVLLLLVYATTLEHIACSLLPQH